MQLLALKRVLAAIDLDGSSRAALTSARDLAVAAGADLHVVHVSRVDEQPPSIDRLLEEAGIGRDSATIHPSVGDASRAIALVSDQVRADVIVMGPHREQNEAPSARLGSTALAVVTNSPVPCLVATRPLRLPLDHVVVGIDLSDTSRGTLQVALSWASALRPREAMPTVLTALHVMNSESPAKVAARSRAVEEALAPIRRAAGGWAGVTLRTEVVQAGNAVAGVASYVERDPSVLLALGTRGLGLDPVGRLGSVSADVMQRVALPVLLVPPAMWKNPAS